MRMLLGFVNRLSMLFHEGTRHLLKYDVLLHVCDLPVHVAMLCSMLRCSCLSSRPTDSSASDSQVSSHISRCLACEHEFKLPW